MVTDEPVPKTALRKKYLVLYDQVPGGTGYLKELMKTPEDIMELLQLAFDKLRDCACQADETKDGCYHCLYAYRISRDLPNISRRQAMELLAEILRHRNQLEKIATVDDIGINALFESELEKRFIEALRRSTTPDCPVTLRSEVVNGKPGYFMMVNDVGYRIEPQVEVGEKEGVSVPCRADFMIQPVRAEREGQLSIAIFTDGFAYHADPSGGNYRLPMDLEQRMALAKSRRYLFWALSYEDVMGMFDDSIKEHWDNFHPGNVDHLLRAFEEKHAIRPIKSVIRKGALGGLVMYLAQPDRSAWAMFANLYAISLDSRGFCSTARLLEHKALLMDDGVGYKNLATLLSGHTEPEQFWCIQPVLGQENHIRAIVLTHGSAKRIRANDYSDIEVLVRFEDSDTGEASAFKRSWNGLLQTMNLIQFLPNASVVSSRFLSEGYSVPHAKEDEVSPESITDIPEDIVAAYGALSQLVLEDALPVLVFAMELGLAVPEAGFELCAPDGQVLGMAELSWHDRKVALLLDGEPAEPFEAAGWRVAYLSGIGDKDALRKCFDKAGE